MTRRRLTPLLIVPFVAVSLVPVPTLAGSMMRVPQSMTSDSEHAGPLIPEFGYKQKKKLKKVKQVDPMKVIRTRMIAGKDVTDKDLLKLAKSGDDLGQYYYARRLEENGDPEMLDDAAGYYLMALKKDREAAEKPLIRLLDGGSLDAQTEIVADAEAVLTTRAGKGDVVARDGLIRMYRAGQPFGLKTDEADALLVAAAEAGDAKAALDLAYAMLSGVPSPARIESAKGYLTIAAKAEDLSIRTQAENILRGLTPGQPQILTVATETSP